MSYPECRALAAAIADSGHSLTEMATIVSDRFNRVSADGKPFNHDFLEGLFTGANYAPDTLRLQLATSLNLREKDIFPEYLIACDRLRQARAKKGWTQQQLAIAASEHGKRILPRAISGYERGSRFCHPSTRGAIAKALAMSEPDLFPEYQKFAG